MEGRNVGHDFEWVVTSINTMTPPQKIRNTTFHLAKKLEEHIKNFKQPSKYLLKYFIRHFPEVADVLDSQPFC